MTGKDATDRARSDTALDTQLRGSAPELPAQVEHSLFDLDRGSSRATVWARRTILESGGTLSSEAVHPAIRALTGHTHRSGNVGDWLPSFDSIDQESPTMWRETSITVRHEDLLRLW